MKMKLPAGTQGYIVLAGLGIVGVLVAYWIVKRTVSDAATAVADVNKGTPYDGTGVVGTLGHGFDAASGGTLSGIGSWIGGKLYDLTHNDPSAEAPAPELITRKQAVSDGFWSNITDLFTPTP